MFSYPGWWLGIYDVPTRRDWSAHSLKTSLALCVCMCIHTHIHIHIHTARGHALMSSPIPSFQTPLRCSWRGKSVALDKEERLYLGTNGVEGLKAEGVFLGCKVLQMSPLEVLWAYHWTPVKDSAHLMTPRKLPSSPPSPAPHTPTWLPPCLRLGNPSESRIIHTHIASAWSKGSYHLYLKQNSPSWLHGRES